MATIGILVDTEEGHILPTFWLSRYLKARGHRVCYLGSPNIERMVRNQGFEFLPIMADAGGVVLQILQRDKNGGRYFDSGAVSSYFTALVRGELLDKAVSELRPEVALVLSEHFLGGLAVRYRYRIPVVLYTPIFRRHARIKEYEDLTTTVFLELKSGVAEFLELLGKAGARLRSFKDVARLVQDLPELVFLPEAFILPGRDEDPGAHYIGAGIDMTRSERPFPWPDIDSNRPLIYCARGSQVQLEKEACRRLFQTTIDAARARPGWQFIIAIGKAFKAEDFSNVPSNAHLFNWVPQLEVLSRSNVMLNHGGFGTIKECIYMGVPMVTLPLTDFRDHSLCAEHVVHHGLGVSNDDLQVSPGELILLIEQILHEPTFNRRVAAMREKFKQQDRLDLAAEVIERAIANSNERVYASA